MGGVLIGFAIIGFVIFVGWLLGTLGIVDQSGRLVLNRVSFFAASPALLFTILAQANLRVVFSGTLVVALLAFLVAALTFAVIARLFFTRDPGRLAIGAYASGYCNINNIGLPVAVYIIGDAGVVAPLFIMQLIILAPILLTVLDLLSAGRVSVPMLLTQPLRNPLVIASALGAVVSVTGVTLPAPVYEPLKILGGAAVPLMLLAFGISLRGDRPLRPRTGRKEVLLAVACKSLLMPVIAFLLARFVLGMGPELIYASTMLAALPTAQNMYQFALRYQTATLLARDTILLTTIASAPVTLLIAWLLRT